MKFDLLTNIKVFVLSVHFYLMISGVLNKY
ncbi:MAG: hypothetical protein ACI909_002421 [Planctomycetota bacterium]|jgi:hypothetical protein